MVGLPSIGGHTDDRSARDQDSSHSSRCQPFASVCRAPTENLAELFDTTLPAVMQRIQSAGVPPAGAPFARYHDFGAKEADVEIGFPVSGPIPDMASLADVAAGEIGAGELPGGDTAVTVHRGSYDGLPQAYDRLHTWIHDLGREDGPGPWESVRRRSRHRR